MILIYEQRFCELEFPQQNRMIHNNKWSNYFQANEAIHERFPQVVLPWVKLIVKSLHEGPKILFMVSETLFCSYMLLHSLNKTTENNHWSLISPWASYQIPNIADCACAGNAGNVSPRRRFQRKPLVSDPGMHHGTCVTHVPWCMSGSHACSDGENVPGIPGACAPAILRIWQEAHCHQGRSFQNWHCGITTVDLCHHANINYWYHGGIFVNCSCN